MATKQQFFTPKFWRKLFSLATIGTAGSITFCGICVYKSNEQFFTDVLMPLVRKLDPEFSHRLAVNCAKYRLVSTTFEDPPCLKTKLLGLDVDNPVGISAGFDKHGEAVIGLRKMGFGFCEVGSVTPEPQEGNPRPRIFRLVEDGAIINRLGFNSEGHDAVYKRLQRVRGKFKGGVMGVNLGKNKTSTDPPGDYVKGIYKFADVADYFVINVSSPNTPGLRDLQKGEALEEILDKAIHARNSLATKVPLFLKIAPDLTLQEQQKIAEEVMKRKTNIEGLIVTNTTNSRSDALKSSNRDEVGGLSGEPLKERATQAIKQMYQLTKGEIFIIGVGGISSGADAYEKIRSGASVVQLYTSFALSGPPVIAKVKKELAQCLENDGFNSVSEAVGRDVNLSK